MTSFDRRAAQTGVDDADGNAEFPAPAAGEINKRRPKRLLRLGRCRAPGAFAVVERDWLPWATTSKLRSSGIAGRGQRFGGAVAFGEAESHVRWPEQSQTSPTTTSFSVTSTVASEGQGGWLGVCGLGRQGGAPMAGRVGCSPPRGILEC